MRIPLKLSLLSALSFLVLSETLAQGVAVGQWRDHLPYSRAIFVAESPDKFYAATPYSLFSYHKEDQAVERLNTITGLSDIGIGAIRFHDASNTLIVAYENGNIDLIKSNKITNLADIRRSTNILSDKSINNILLIGDFAYLSCGFGIIVLDMNSQNIKDTYLIGDNGSYVFVNDMETDGANLYAATTQGVYTASLSDPNLNNFENWTILNNSAEHTIYDDLFYFNNTLYANYKSTVFNSDTIYYKDSGDWKMFTGLTEKGNNSIEVIGEEILFAHATSITRYNKNWERINNIFTYGNETSPAAQHAIISKDGTNILIADGKFAMVISPVASQWSATLVTPKGPSSINTHGIASQNNTVWVAPGGRTANWQNLFLGGQLMSFRDEEWATMSASTTAKLQGVSDVLSIAIDPLDDNHLYAASLGDGLIEVKNGVVQEVYDYTNSILEQSNPENPSWNWTGISDLAFDSQNNLWMTNSLVTSALKTKTSSGEWISYDFTGTITARTLGNMLIDHLDQKWIVLPGGGGLVVFSENGTLKNFSDDQFIKLSNAGGNGDLPSNTVYCLAQDADNEIWVGTDLGIAVFYAPENVFTGRNFDASQILVNQDGYNGFLLETEIVTAIAVDGADRKWIGTEGSGVFLISSDGTEEILHFTKENSPLFSNIITSIEINDETGEVFIGTDRGLIAYKGTATGIEYEFSDVYAYPNPVRGDYDGLIAIKGLYRNASVKITDISGNLVYETFAEGGQAVWNGRDFAGNKANSGVYLVFCASSDGTQTHVAKIMFVN